MTALTLYPPVLTYWHVQKGVLMEKFDSGIMRFFDVETMVNKKFDMAKEQIVWLPVSKIAEIIGVPMTVGSCTQIGVWATKKGLKKGRSKNQRLVLMPMPNMEQ
jgi:hypothetical protein